MYIFFAETERKSARFLPLSENFGMRHFATVVIGGGAAGIMAAGVAASRRGNVLLCERMEKPSAKCALQEKDAATSQTYAAKRVSG